MATNEIFNNSEEFAAKTATQLIKQRQEQIIATEIESKKEQIIQKNSITALEEQKNKNEKRAKKANIEVGKITEGIERDYENTTAKIDKNLKRIKIQKEKRKKKKRKILVRRLAAATTAVAIIGSIIYSQREEISKAPENTLDVIESMFTGGMTQEELELSFTEKTKDLQERFKNEKPSDVINSFEDEKDANTAFLIFNALNYNSDTQGIISNTAEKCNFVNPNNDKTSNEALIDVCKQNGQNISNISAQTGENFNTAAFMATSKIAYNTKKDIATGELTVPTAENTKGGNTL